MAVLSSILAPRSSGWPESLCSQTPYGGGKPDLSHISVVSDTSLSPHRLLPPHPITWEKRYSILGYTDNLSSSNSPSRLMFQKRTSHPTPMLLPPRTNKGWNFDDQLDTTPAPPCPCDDATPRDAAHLTTCCPLTAEGRPNNPDTIHEDKHVGEWMEWARKHGHLGYKPPRYEVRWIHLSRLGNHDFGKDHSCDVCDFVTSKKCNLDAHMVTHQRTLKKAMVANADGTYDCDFEGCNAVRMTKERYKNHRRKHAPAADRTCTTCGKVYQARETLQKHMQQAHPGATVPDRATNPHATHECSTCHKRYTSKKSLGSHELLEHRPMVCDGCNASLTGKKELRVHQRSACTGSRS